MKSAAEWGISLLLFFVSLFLTVTSYLYYIDKQDMSWHKDQTLLLIILSVLFLIGLRLLSKWISHRKNPTRANHILFWSVFAIIMGFSAWWIANARSLAQSDAASLHQMALSIIRNGDYSMIAPKGSYLSLWPFQTGLLLYYEGILRLIPDYNVVPMQILNWGYLGAGLISAYFLVRKWFHDEKVTACFSVLLLFCWPWYFYVNFAYGEMPSISAMLVVSWMITLYLEHKKKRFLGIALITLGFGVMLRKNLSIFVVASVLILLVSILQRYQKQYLFAIAGMIAMKPECLILDEPTAMLDPKGRAEIVNTILRLNKENGMTVVLITHYMEEAEKADRVLVMNDGKFIADGTPKETTEATAEAATKE